MRSARERGEGDCFLGVCYWHLFFFRLFFFSFLFSPLFTYVLNLGGKGISILIRKEKGGYVVWETAKGDWRLGGDVVTLMDCLWLVIDREEDSILARSWVVDILQVIMYARWLMYIKDNDFMMIDSLLRRGE